MRIAAEVALLLTSAGIAGQFEGLRRRAKPKLRECEAPGGRQVSHKSILPRDSDSRDREAVLGRGRIRVRTETWANWVVGLGVGIGAGFVLLLGGALLLLLGIVFVALGFVARRSLAFLSGAFIGLGVLWFGLTILARLAGIPF
jgi:hypothetical protein